jgi:hypothetical protein
MMIVAFRSAKVASVIATFAEQKATHFVALSIGSQPIRESSVRLRRFCGAKGDILDALVEIEKSRMVMVFDLVSEESV